MNNKEHSIDFAAIGQDLGKTFFNNHEFIIPRYQRPYEWKKEQLEEFWFDLTNNKHSYFIGNLIFNTSKLKSHNEMEIIDGQQRLLTVTIFYSAVYNNAKDIDKVLAANFYENDIKPTNSATLEEFYRITPGESTFKYFRTYIQSKNSDIINSNTCSKEEARVKSNYIYFDKKIKERIKSLKSDKDRIQELKDLRIKIRGLQVINTTVGDEDTAYEVFETTNARGIDLTTADLLKNYIFRNFKDEDGFRDIAKETWGDLKKRVEATNTDLKQFIRYYWISKYAFLTDSKLFKAIKSTIQIDEMDQFLTDLDNSSQRFNMIKEGGIKDFQNAISKEYDSVSIYESIYNLRLMGVSQSNVLLLSLLRNIDNLGADPTLTFKMIEKFSFQYFFVCSQPGNNVEKIFSNFAIHIENAVNKPEMAIEIDKDTEIRPEISINKKMNTIYQSLRSKLLELRKTNVEGIFEENFSSLSLKESDKSRKMMKYILNNFNTYFKIPEDIRSNKKKLLKFKIEEKTDFSKIDLEHILPRKPQKWNLTVDDVKDYVNMLGNLTILSSTLNSSAQNFTLDKKVEFYKKSKLEINKLLNIDIEKNNSEWNEKSIRERQLAFSKLALDLWSF
tara:strand:- start:85 stop:1932 length:1848 start_codon:yes stop_codon:yes gene_type:complete